MRRLPDGVLFFVSAGPAQTLTSTLVAQLAGTAATGGKPAYTYKWTVVSKPVGSTVVFSDDTSLTSTATIDVDPGVYVLRLRATDANSRTSDSYVTITSALTVTGILAGLLVEYWDSELGIALVSGAVDTWTGQKLGYVLQAPGAAQRPVYEADGTNFKGRLAVRFDGNAGVLPSLLQGTGALVGAGSRLGLLMVRRSTGVTGGAMSFDLDGRLYQRIGSFDGIYGEGGATNPSRGAPSVVPTTDEGSRNAVDGLQYYADGALVASEAALTGTNSAVNNVNTNGVFNLPVGSVYVVAYYVLNAQMSAGQRASFKVYSAGHWGTP